MSETQQQATLNRNESITPVQSVVEGSLHKLSIPENVLSQELNGEVVLLNMENESYYSLNSLGSRIWQLFTHSENLDAVIQQLLQVYVVDKAKLHRDVTEFVGELSAEELLISCHSQELEEERLL